MRHHLLGFRSGVWTSALLLLGSALSLFGCASAPSPHNPPDTATACAEWQWIGITRDGGTCPDIPGWRANLLFEKDLADQEKSRAAEQKQYEKPAGPQRASTEAIVDELRR